MMNRGFDVLTVTQEPLTASAVSEALRPANGQIAAHEVCRTVADLDLALHRASRRNSPPCAVIVDIDPSPAQILADLAPIIDRNINARFLAVSDDQRSDFVLQAMQAGVRHYLLKDRLKCDLPSILSRLTPPSPVPTQTAHGSIVTVLSAGGGCGATTFAINLAYELNLLLRDDLSRVGEIDSGARRTLVVDLDCHYGSAMGYLGLTANYCVGDVLAAGDRMDSQLLRSAAVPCGEELHVLASPATVNLEWPAVLEHRHLAQLLNNAREVYGWTVVEAPRVTFEVAGMLAAASEMTYLVFEMNVEDIRVAKALYGSLLARGVAAERVMPLVNRWQKRWIRREMISLDQARRAIGCSTLETLSNDYKAVLSNVNLGKPLSATAPRSALRLDIQKLASALQSKARGNERHGPL